MDAGLPLSRRGQPAIPRAWILSPSAELLTIDAAGHFPWLEQPVSFFPRVNEFLRRGDVR